MTLFEAERLVRAYWAKPQRSPLGEAALHARLIADILHGGFSEAAAVAFTILFYRLTEDRS